MPGEVTCLQNNLQSVRSFRGHVRNSLCGDKQLHDIPQMGGRKLAFLLVRSDSLISREEK
jgi:hypothetical protein